MDELVTFMGTLNPKPSEDLIFGCQYHLWRAGEYIDYATWTKDANIGNSFQKMVISNGELIRMVYSADYWELKFDCSLTKH